MILTVYIWTEALDSLFLHAQRVLILTGSVAFLEA
jgi:hypothetical protein